MTDNKEVNQKRRVNVFQVKAINNTNTAKISHQGYITDGERFADELIDIGGKDIMNNGETALKISPSIFAKFYKCNITDAYLLTNKKLPILYGTVMYERPFTTGYLFNLTVYLEITNDLTLIKDPSKILNTMFTGKYSIDIEIDENQKETIPLDNFSTYEKITQQLLTIIKTPAMTNIIQIELKKRDEERIKRLGGMMEFTIPKATYNFDELVRKYEKGEDLGL
jgi:hypothetical protein